jgi:hypothetical protein
MKGKNLDAFRVEICGGGSDCHMLIDIRGHSIQNVDLMLIIGV